MKTPDRNLFDDVFSDANREATLRAAAAKLRGRRIRRRIALVAPSLLAVAAALIVTVRVVAPDPETPVAVAAGPRALSDDQLLAMFPGVPRAIVTVNGKKRLVFPRPEDAARYIGRAAVADMASAR